MFYGIIKRIMIIPRKLNNAIWIYLIEFKAVIILFELPILAIRR